MRKILTPVPKRQKIWTSKTSGFKINITHSKRMEIKILIKYILVMFYLDQNPKVNLVL